MPIGVFNPVIAALCEIYCHGPILEAVQEARLFSDSKYFVDMPLKFSINETLSAFFKLSTSSMGKDELAKFVNDYFDLPGAELEVCTPHDWSLQPDFLLERDLSLRTKSWLFHLHELWLQLCRKVKPWVKTNQEMFSSLYVPNPFIVPGGRFREFYYWDSYWTIKGLLVSCMYSTARGMIENLAYMVQTHGFIPNGGRVYYLHRSQPPLFIKMVEEYYEATEDLDFVKDMFPSMLIEFDFWIKHRSVKIVDSWYSFVYKVNTSYPRPESHKEDVELVKQFKNIQEKMFMWSQIASGAESGWDFSSRWFSRKPPNAYRIQSIRTWSIVPVDLNAFMCMNAKILADLAQLLGDHKVHEKYKSIFKLSKEVLRRIHWNENDGIWYDYDLERNEQVKEYYISNAVPVFAKCFENSNAPVRVFEYMKRVGAFEHPHGIPTSFVKSGEQWDADNAWAPLVHMVVDGFHDTQLPMLQEAAKRFGVNWLLLTFDAYVTTCFMFEKYNTSRNVDAPYADGGEYEVQTGFGWTNGVTMTFLLRYGPEFEQEVFKLTKS